MARLATSLLPVIALGLLALPAPLPADTPAKGDAAAGDVAIKNTLALQRAMQDARYLLQHGNDAKKAVTLLEEQLPRVNGNAEFLRLLRDAYRAHIRDLYLASQPGPAEVYLERLCVLEPGAATDATLRPQPEAPRPVAAKAKPPETAKPAPANVFPDFGKFFKGGSTKTAQAATKPAVVRGVAAEETTLAEDPFDVRNERLLPITGEKAREKRAAALRLLTQADDEFQKHHYGQALAFYEQAHQTEPDSVADRRAAWGYCMLSNVVEQLDTPNLAAQALTDLRKQVQSAVTLAPGLDKTGQQALQQIDQRLKVQIGTTTAVASVGVTHLGQNREGWIVAETTNFRIFHKQDKAFGEQVAQIAERTRAAMARKWFGAGPAESAWQPKCELIVHPTGQEYSQMTGVPSSSPGHSRIESDKSNAARVLARRMDMRLDSPGMLEAVLPHETTHVVIAGQFGSFPVPRWADEGIAVLTEPPAKVEQHHANLRQCHQDGLLFGLKELMVLENYPEPRRISAFYAQSVVLVEFLASKRGPTVFTRFVRDGLREGYEAALQRHYGMDFAQLEQAWSQQVLGGQKLAAGN